MARDKFDPTWDESPADIILLTNSSKKNFILELPTGRYRLDAGRRMRTLRSIMKLPQVKALIDDGMLAVEPN